MSRIRVAAVLGLVGVGLGAFGAHGLRGRVSTELLDVYRTGVLYHLVHAVALLALAGLKVRWGRAVFALWVAGVIVFSGSLYLLAVTGARWLGAVTPLGGLAFLAGWVGLAVGPAASYREASAPRNKGEPS